MGKTRFWTPREVLILVGLFNVFTTFILWTWTSSITWWERFCIEWPSVTPFIAKCYEWKTKLFRISSTVAVFGRLTSGSLERYQNVHIFSPWWWDSTILIAVSLTSVVCFICLIDTDWLISSFRSFRFRYVYHWWTTVITISSNRKSELFIQTSFDWWTNQPNYPI